MGEALIFLCGWGVGGITCYGILIFMSASKTPRDEYEAQDSACIDCSRAGYDCPIYPQSSSHCVERRARP